MAPDRSFLARMATGSLLNVFEAWTHRAEGAATRKQLAAIRDPDSTAHPPEAAERIRPIHLSHSAACSR